MDENEIKQDLGALQAQVRSLEVQLIGARALAAYLASKLQKEDAETDAEQEST